MQIQHVNVKAFVIPGWKERKMNVKRIVFIVLGSICLGLGCIGIALPILPTVPFFLATVFFYANSSRRLHDWFVSTKMYKKHLESFVQKKGMLMQTKINIITMVTLLMGIGFFMMFRKEIYVPCVILTIVWVCHLIYFFFGVKTIKNEENVH